MRVVRGIALLTLVFLTGSYRGTEAVDEGENPNIIFILADDLGWSDLSCYGSTYYKTPSLDRMAAQGLRFTDAYAACPVCSPTRGSINTGRYPARLRLTDYLPGRGDDPANKLLRASTRQSLPQEEITIAEALKSAGYATACIGKWHLGDDPHHPVQQGYDVVLGSHLGQRVRNFYFSPYGMENLTDGPPGEYLTDRLTAEAVKFIEDHREQPFFLYLSHYAVHSPLQANEQDIEEWRNRAAELEPPTGPRVVLEPNPDEPGAAPRALTDSDSPDDYLGRRMVPVRQRQDAPVMAAMIQSLDKSVGRVLEALEKQGLAGNTVVIFTSDNGGLASQRQPTAGFQGTANLPLRGGKGWLYEGGVRVPLIIQWPGKIQPGGVSREVTISTDYYPTILQIAGLPVPTDRNLDGLSLVPILEGKRSLKREAVFWHWPHYSNHGRQSPGGAVRAGDYKLIEYFENGTLQLFNLRTDIGEQHDLARKMPEKATELRELLRQWRQSVDAQMPAPNPDYKPRP